MKSVTSISFIVIILSLAINGCGPSPTPTVPTPTSVLPTSTPVPPTPTAVPQGETIIVTSTADSGPNTLRQALQDAQSGDIITFDPAVFPPSAPATIYLTSGLPSITQGNLTIDASNAGVILDGTDAQGEWVVGIPIHSDSNTIQGLQIVNFSGAGIQLLGQYNKIGGDRSEGSGPTGQGNLLSGNADGIGIEGASAVHNQISGNLIGTDVTGKGVWGNQNPGIFIQDGANSTIIGPDNVIAHNEFGIDIRDPGSFGNTITQNSIHDNSVAGIWMQQGANRGLPVPVIFDFDLAVGTLTGAASPNSIVEIFSDGKNEGEIYEGQAKADGSGFFTFNKGTPLAGPYLTATATDSGGNTSMFSVPTSGTGRFLVLQQGNSLPKTRLESKQSSELADNRIGGLWANFWTVDMEWVIDNEILPMGLKRVKVAINDISADLADLTKPELTIDPSHDDVITRIADNGITITFVLTFWDTATWPGGEGANCPRFKTEEEIERYLDFVRFIVRHFKDRVQYFEIWNEPDIGWDEQNIEMGIQAIEVDDYINLVRRVVPVIRQEYPDAKIVVGSTMPQAVPGSRQYLLTILSSDIMPLVDVVAWHPGGPSPEYEYWREYYYIYPSLVQEIKDLASAHGFNGEYSADEMVWWTEEDVPPWEPWTYSDRKAAKYYARFIIMHLGMDVTAQAGGISNRRVVSFPTIQNLCTVMAGAEPVNLPVEIQSQATNMMSYSFSLPNGDRLLALWTHGVAVDEDSGINATLTIPGFSVQKVTGIDVLNGFEQELVTNMEDGNLVISNLLVKDYPIILHLIGISSP
ncbi:MAG: right-handed parallel beta-helix repeat-containing protein [Chloroflexota bacterium]